MNKMICALAMTTALSGAASAQMPDPGNPDSQRLAPAGILDFDADKDGTVTRLEYFTNAVNRFTRMDANKDDSLTPEERNAERGPGTGLPLLNPNSPTSQPGQATGQGGGGGNGADVDGDGLISRDEYFFNLGRLYARYDANGDNKITPDEIAPPTTGAESPPR